MRKNLLSAREIQRDDIELIAQYWLSPDSAFLISMGVDLNKLPSVDVDLQQVYNAEMRLRARFKPSL